MLHRRQLLRAAALSPAMGPAMAALPAQAADDHARPFDAPYAPVLSQPSREIRTVVGLRPYRGSGFRLEHEKFGRRDVIHNYGHGGCGVTLSWGCAQLSVELAEKIDQEARERVSGDAECDRNLADERTDRVNTQVAERRALQEMLQH